MLAVCKYYVCNMYALCMLYVGYNYNYLTEIQTVILILCRHVGIFIDYK